MTDKTRIRRLPERGVSDRETIYSILDDGLLCHVAYVTEERPVVIPTLYVRDGDRLLVHGSNSMGIARAVRTDSSLCIAVSHIDGLVVARSAFNSSANYRSVVIHGLGRVLWDEEKTTAFDLIVDKLIPGRLSDVRPSTSSELAQTSVIEVPLDEMSAKVRTGGPVDDAADLDDDVWAGVIPMRMVVEEPIMAPDLPAGINLPDYLASFRR